MIEYEDDEQELEETGNIEKKTTLGKVSIKDLRVHPTSRMIYGERKVSRAVKELAANIRLIGQLEPITINSQNYILSGVRRYYAGIYLGLQELLTIRIEGYNPDEETIIIVSSNKQRVKTPRQIVNEAEAILGTFGKTQGQRTDLLKFDETHPYGKIGKNKWEVTASITGSNISEIRRLLKVSDFEKESDENRKLGLLERIVKKEISLYRATTLIGDLKHQKEERVRAIRKKSEPKVTSSDSSPFAIYNSSSNDMKEVKSGSVQVVFTSPPYWNLRNYGNEKLGAPELGLERTVQEYILALSRHLRDVKRVLNDKGSFFLNIGDTYRAGENCLIPTRLLLNLCDNEGWYAVNEIIWKKSGGVPQGKTKRLQPIYEKVFHLVKDPQHYYYEEFRNWKESDAVQLVKMRGSRTAKSTEKNQGGFVISKTYERFRDFLDEQTVKDIINGSTASTRQLELKKLDSSVDHPALMPLYLPIIPILTTSKEGDTVLDPFSGSGTTGKSALIFGRKYIGYELNPEFYELSKRDLDNTIEDLSLPETSSGGGLPPTKITRYVHPEEDDDEDGWV